MSDLKMKKIGLALSGGSAFGYAHIGVLQAFEENNIPISCIAGTSAGSMVAACYAFGVPISIIKHETKNLSWYDLSKFSYSRMGLINSEKIGLLIEDIVGDQKIENSKIPLAIVATNLIDGCPVVFKNGSLTAAVRASVSIPGIFEPYEKDGMQLIDGGMSVNLPVEYLKDLGAEFMIGVNLSRYRLNKKATNIIDVMMNTLNLMIKNQTNQSAVNLDVSIDPHLEDYSSADLNKMSEIIDAGYKAAILAMPEIKNKLNLQQDNKKIISYHSNPWLKFIDWLSNED